MEPSVFVCPVVMGADLDREREKYPAEPGLLIDLQIIFKKYFKHRNHT